VTVTVLDRRKKSTEQKTFESTVPECPKSQSTLYAMNEMYVDGHADDKEIESWLRTRVKPGASTEAIAIPPAGSKLLDGGNVSGEALRGFVTLSTFRARMNQAKLEINTITEATDVSPELAYAFMKDGAGGCKSGLSVTLTSYSSEHFNKVLPTATHIDDSRGIRVMGVNRKLVDLVAAQLPKVTDDINSVANVARAIGATMGKLQSTDLSLTSQTAEVSKAGLGTVRVTVNPFAKYNGQDGYASKRGGDYVLAVRCGEKPSAAAETLNRLVK
jgi:hypothetical protein